MSTLSNVPPSTASEGLSPAGTTEQAPSQVVGADDRLERIRQAAYSRYEKRGFEGGYEEEDWLAAEAEIDGSPDVSLDQMP